MLDKLEMRTKEEIDLNILKNIFPRHQLCVVRDSIYRNCIVVKNGNKEIITIKTNPTFGEAYESKIIINPSKWESFDELTSFLPRLCNPKNLEICRIDHATDILLSIDHIYSGIRIKYKRDGENFKENCTNKGSFLTGFNIGQYPELYCIYDKGYQLTSKKLKRDKNYERGILTRIELRQYKDKVKYKNLSELINYVDDPPFSGIEFNNLNDEMILNPKAQQLYLQMNHYGFSRTRAILNEQNNFDRSYKKYLKPTDLQTMLNEKYQEELRHFFQISNLNLNNTTQQGFKAWSK